MVRRIVNFTFCLLLVTLTSDVSAMSGGKRAGGSVHPVISKSDGYVSIKGSKLGVWEPVVENTLILSSDYIRTAPNSWARLEFKRGAIELYGSSMLYVSSTKGESGEMDITDVVLLKGTAKFDIDNNDSDWVFGFRTENTFGAVENTLFVVTTDGDQTSVAVYKGKVSLRNPIRGQEEELSLSRGRLVTILADGSVEGLGIFNANKASSLLAQGVEPDISNEGLQVYEADQDDDGSDGDGGDRDMDREEDGDDDKDKDGDIKIKGKGDRFESK